MKLLYEIKFISNILFYFNFFTLNLTQGLVNSE